MITPELVGYIRSEFGKGRTREEIHKMLMADGGWSETDLSEAFRIVIPMQGFGESSVAAKTKSSLSSSSSLWKILLIIIVIGALCFATWYFYRPNVASMWSSLVNGLPKFSIPYFGNKETNNTVQPVPQNNTIVKKTNPIKDCGIGTVPDLKKPSTYENDTVLTCLGNSALSCELTKAILKDALFPTIFEITQNMNDQNICNFKLSYPEDSTLIDITGKKLALQYISCPISVVKAIDETNPKSPIFKVPSKDNLSKYASVIYFYGTLGVFMERDVDKNKIQSLGCNGPYIDSVVAGYQKMQSKKSQ